MSLVLMKNEEVYIQSKEMHDLLLKDYIDNIWKDKDVEVDWEYLGPGVYSIHEHTDTGLPCISLKWERV